jgi:hypothetical protein
VTIFSRTMRKIHRAHSSSERSSARRCGLTLAFLTAALLARLRASDDPLAHVRYWRRTKIDFYYRFSNRANQVCPRPYARICVSSARGSRESNALPPTQMVFADHSEVTLADGHIHYLDKHGSFCVLPCAAAPRGLFAPQSLCATRKLTLPFG